MRGNDEREAFGDVPNVPYELRAKVVLHIREIVAKLCLIVTGGTLSAASLGNIDVILRIMLSFIGIVSGSYALLYYRKKLRMLDENRGNDD